MKYSDYYWIDYKEDLYNALLKEKITVKISEALRNDKKMVFKLILNPGETWKYHYLLPKDDTPVRSMIFSEEERQNAAWLDISPRLCSLLEIKNGDHAFQYSCTKEQYEDGELHHYAYHRTQANSFAFNHFQWKSKHHILGVNEGLQFVFSDDYAKLQLQDSDLNGLSFMPVYKWYRKQTDEVLDNVFQWNIEHSLPEDALKNMKYAEEMCCPMCGRKKYDTGGEFRLGIDSRFLLPNVDFYKTPEIYGWGIPYSRVVISQKAYQFLKAHDMDKSFFINPVILY